MFASVFLLIGNLVYSNGNSPPPPPPACTEQLNYVVANSGANFDCSKVCPANTSCTKNAVAGSNNGMSNVACTPKDACSGNGTVCNLNNTERGYCVNETCNKCPSGYTSLLDNSLPKTLSAASCQGKSNGDTCEQDGECLETTNGLSCLPSSVCKKEGASCNIQGVLGSCNANDVCIALPVSTQSTSNCQTYSFLPNSLMAFLFLVLARQLIKIQRKKIT